MNKLFLLLLTIISSYLSFNSEIKANVVNDYKEDFSVTSSKLRRMDTSFAVIQVFNEKASSRIEAAYKMLGLTEKDAPISFNGAWCARFQSKVCEYSDTSEYPNSPLVTDWVNYLRTNGEIYKVTSGKFKMPLKTLYLEEELEEVSHSYVKPGDYLFHKQNSGLGNSHILLCVYVDSGFIVAIDGNGNSFSYGNEYEKELAHNFITKNLGIDESYSTLKERLGYSDKSFNVNRVFYKVLKRSVDNEGRPTIGDGYITHVGRLK